MAKNFKEFGEIAHQNGIKINRRTANMKLFKRKAELCSLHDQTMQNPELINEAKGYEEGHKKRNPGD